MGILRQLDMVVRLSRPYILSLYPSRPSDSPASLVEMYVGIICACLPSLKALGAHSFPHVFKTSPDALRLNHDGLRFSLLTPFTAHLRTWTSRRTVARPPTENEETVAHESTGSGRSDTLASHSDCPSRVGTKKSGGGVVVTAGETGRTCVPGVKRHS